jgi:hypothetical protein
VDVRSTETGVELVIETPKRWWQFWLPDVIYVPLTRGQVIVFYQSVHKHATKAMILD